MKSDFKACPYNKTHPLPSELFLYKHTNKQNSLNNTRYYFTYIRLI